jgi:hypothetical protein
MKNNDIKLPQLIPDGFASWGDVSVARAIAYSNVMQIAQHLSSRDNYDPEFSPEEILKFQKYLYADCLNNSERDKLPFHEFIGDFEKEAKRLEAKDEL